MRLYAEYGVVLFAALLPASWWVGRRLGVVALAAAVLTCFARVFVGAHYPGDVLAGLGVGALVTLAGYVLGRPLRTGHRADQLTRSAE